LTERDTWPGDAAPAPPPALSDIRLTALPVRTARRVVRTEANLRLPILEEGRRNNPGIHGQDPLSVPFLW